MGVRIAGVYLKYVGLSLISFYAFQQSLPQQQNHDFDGEERRMLLISLKTHLLSSPTSLFFGWSTLLNGTIAILFRLRSGMSLIGKNPKTGQIPLWSYVIYFPFHFPTRLYAIMMGYYRGSFSKNKTPLATEIEKGFWIGGRSCHKMKSNNNDKIVWSSIVDLTVEFPESCECKAYLNIPLWDGNPPTKESVEEAATFAVQAQRKDGGNVLIHCAFGKGRSAMIMCATLVKAGFYSTWEEAFEKGVKPKRPVSEECSCD